MPRTPTSPDQRKSHGARIAWARAFVVPNRHEFARMLQVDPSTIRNIENGSRGPSIELLQRICATLRISPDYVLHGQLSGVDPELAALLAAHHPELVPARLRSRTARMDQPSVAHYEPTKPVENFA